MVKRRRIESSRGRTIDNRPMSSCVSFNRLDVSLHSVEPDRTCRLYQLDRRRMRRNAFVRRFRHDVRCLSRVRRTSSPKCHLETTKIDTVTLPCSVVVVLVVLVLVLVVWSWFEFTCHLLQPLSTFLSLSLTLFLSFFLLLVARFLYHFRSVASKVDTLMSRHLHSRAITLFAFLDMLLSVAHLFDVGRVRRRNHDPVTPST